MSNALTKLQSMQPQTMAEALAFAERIKNSPLVPKQFQGRPGDILAAMVYGEELGLKPMQSLQGIAVINGKPSLYGDSLLSVVSAHPHCEDIAETYDDETETACCIVKRKGRSPVVGKFSVGDAKRAGLWGKSGPWQQYPSRMLQMRARAFALRDSFADALRGMSCVEETQDYHVREVRNVSSQTANNSTANRQLPAAQVVEAAVDSDAAPTVLSDVLRGFTMSTSLNELAIASGEAKKLVGSDIDEARCAYLSRREKLRKELGIDTKPQEPEQETEPQPEPEQSATDFGPPPMTDDDAPEFRGGE